MEAAVCDACARLSKPTAAHPNAVVASLVHGLAQRIRQQGGSPQCNFGQAWQTQCYVRMALAEESGRADGDTRANQHRKEASGTEGLRPSHPHESPGRRGAPRETVHGPPPGTGRQTPRNRDPRLGLVGYATASGLGQLNRDLAEQGGVDGWLVAEHPRFPMLEVLTARCPVQHFGAGDHTEQLRRWLQTVDWIVWAEACPIARLPQLAREAGVRIACVPMWEFISPTDRWLRDVDLLICPTQQAYDIFAGWKLRFGFRWRVVRFPWPIPADRFRFRVRQRCQQFLFVNGRGGAPARSIASEGSLGRRKGLDTILAAARLSREVPWTIYTQQPLDTEVPDNVRVRYQVGENTSIYDEGDVCVQPSRWEGVGLPLLECQAAGMPLITVDAAPMNEYRPLRTMTPSGWSWGYLCDGQPIHVPTVAPTALAEVVRGLYGQSVREASFEAREWVERERSWDRAIDCWRRLFSAWPFLDDE